MAYEFSNTKAFSQENGDLVTAMKEYAHGNFGGRSKEECEILIDKAFASAIEAKSGFTMPTENSKNYKTAVKAYCANPMVAYFANEVTNNLIDAVLPTIMDESTLRFIAETKYADLGDTIKFDLESNALLHVSKADYRRRRINAQKTFDSTITMTGENHMITVADNLFNILIGSAHIARDVMRASLSMQNAMLVEAYAEFEGAMSKLSSPLKVTNFDEKDAITLAETVTAYNQGRKAVFMGTPVALKSILPSNSNYRYLLDDAYVKLGALNQFNGYDVIPMAQVADPYASTPYALKLDNTKVYVVSPASDKILKIGVFGGTMSGAINPQDSANTEASQTLQKGWETAIATNSIAGVIDLQG